VGVEDKQANIGARRPIAARESRWAVALAAYLARLNVSPNSISVLSVVFATVAGLSLLATRFLDQVWAQFLLFALAAVGIQCRLLCNMLDGMVAVEGGRASRSGEVFNDFPDRLADPIVLVCAGYAAGGIGPSLGWAAALLAVMTAYVRVLGRSLGSDVHFTGPMAKQHRMAVMTTACVVAAPLALWQWQQLVLFAALIVVAVGSLLTVGRRLRRIVRELEQK
jgi:phosphatidylglycerophosphate synthase